MLVEVAECVAGLPLSFFNLLLTILSALIVNVSIKVVGSLLVSALLTIPVACSLIVARSFKQTIWISVLYGEIAVIGGLIAAGLLDSAPGGTIVLLLIVMLLVRSEEHTSELQSRGHLVCRLLLEKKKTI